MLNLKNGGNSSVYNELVRCLSHSLSFYISGLTSFAKLILLDRIRRLTKRKILFITSSEQNALKYQNDLSKAFELDAKILPYQSISMYEEMPSNKYDYAEQIEILRNQPEVVIAPVKVLLEKFPISEFFKREAIHIKKGDTLDLAKLAHDFVRLGYKRSTMVSDIGEFSIRGDIIDIFSLDKNALRIELWGDEVVDLRYFNNETQKSIEKIEFAEILPMFKFIAEDYVEGIEVFQNNYNRDWASVLDYLKDYVIVFDESEEVYARYEYFEENFIKAVRENEFSNPLEGINHFTLNDFKAKCASFIKVGLDNFLNADYDVALEFNSSVIPNFEANIDKISDFILSKPDYQIVIATDYPERVKELLGEYGIFNLEYIPAVASFGTEIEEFKFVLLTDRELFNKRNKEITSTKRAYYKESAEFIESINDIKEGEFVVHAVHGIGIYKGLSHETLDGQIKDYLTIEYANGDKLYMPAEQINQLCRYRGSGAIKPKLSRMGGKDWDNVKSRVKKEVETVAYDLLKLYARRKMQKGIQFLPDTNWQVEMEEAFEFTETPDQMRAINEVKADMENENPMDRLICGDVGFGKTEVAMRAIFKAVTSGKQADRKSVV